MSALPVAGGALTRVLPAEAAPAARAAYVGPEGRELFAWYHAPAAARARDCAVLVVPPLWNEGIFAHRGLRHLAERLAERGFPTLRHDHPGAGDSAGGRDDAEGVDAWLAGVHAAADALRLASGASRVALVGVRLGATLAALAAAARDDVAGLVLWAPIASGARHARELRMAAGGACDGGGLAVGGFVVGGDVLEGVRALDLRRLAAAPAPRVLCVPRGDLPDDAPALAAQLEALGAAVELREAPGYAGMVDEPHRSVVPTTAIDAIGDWLAAWSAPGGAEGDAVAGATAFGAPELLVAAPDGTMLRERPMRFVGAGVLLAGIVTERAGGVDDRRPALLLVNSGSVYRVGPSRQYVELAREWAARGVRVLRLDLPGLGDSPTAPGCEENHPYAASAPDGVAAGVAALRALGSSRVTVLGRCSGAHAAFRLALDQPELPGLAGIVLVNPIVFYWKPTDALDFGAWRDYSELRYYREAARDPRTWMRVLRGRVNPLGAARTLVRRARGVAGGWVARAATAALGRRRPDDVGADLSALARRGIRVHLVFAQGEPGLDYLTRHAASALRRLRRRAGFRLDRIPNADHTFSPPASQVALREVLWRWMDSA